MGTKGGGDYYSVEEQRGQLFVRVQRRVLVLWGIKRKYYFVVDTKGNYCHVCHYYFVGIQRSYYCLEAQKRTVLLEGGTQKGEIALWWAQIGNYYSMGAQRGQLLLCGGHNGVIAVWRHKGGHYYCGTLKVVNTLNWAQSVNYYYMESLLLCGAQRTALLLYSGH